MEIIVHKFEQQIVDVDVHNLSGVERWCESINAPWKNDAIDKKLPKYSK